jgi:hypothetical protein
MSKSVQFQQANRQCLSDSSHEIYAEPQRLNNDQELGQTVYFLSGFDSSSRHEAKINVTEAFLLEALLKACRCYGECIARGWPNSFYVQRHIDYEPAHSYHKPLC